MKRLTMVLVCLLFPISEVKADVVTDWNITAIAVAPGSGLGNLPQARIITLMHLAIHDALNSIQPRYETFSGVNGQHNAASPEAAVAAAAYRVLISGFPAQAAAINSAYAASLATVPDG